MPKPEHELKEAKIKFLSVVPRGANGEPFRILKADEEGGLDLIAAVKGEPSKPEAGDGMTPRSTTMKGTLILVAAQKGADVTSVIAALQKAEMKAEGVETKNGTTIFQQADAIPADTQMFEVTDNVFVGISGLPFRKADLGTSWDADSFDEAIGTAAIMPMMNVAREVLGIVTTNAIRKAQTQQEAQDKTKAATDQFQAYVTRLISSIPVTAFKFDEALGEVLATKDVGEATTDDIDVALGAKPGDTKNSTEGDTVNKADASGATSVNKQEQPGAEAGAGASADKTDDKADPLKGLAEMISGLSQKMDDQAKATGEAIAAIKQEVKTVAKSAEKTASALKGTPVGGVDGDDPEDPEQKVQKSADDGWGFDTANRPWNN